MHINEWALSLINSLLRVWKHEGQAYLMLHSILNRMTLIYFSNFYVLDLVFANFYQWFHADHESSLLHVISLSRALIGPRILILCSDSIPRQLAFRSSTAQS